MDTVQGSSAHWERVCRNVEQGLERALAGASDEADAVTRMRDYYGRLGTAGKEAALKLLMAHVAYVWERDHVRYVQRRA